MKPWTTSKQGISIKSYCFFEKIAERFKNYELMSGFLNLSVRSWCPIALCAIKILPELLPGGQHLHSVLSFFLLENSQTIFQKQPPGGVLRKRCSESMHQIYRTIPKPKCDLLFSEYLLLTTPLDCCFLFLKS